MRSDTRTRALEWLLVGVLAVAGTAAGCGDDSDEPSAEEQVCDAGSELRASLEQVATDIRAVNFGDASDDLSQVSEAYDGLVSAVGDLAEEERDVLEPQVDALASDITSLADAGSLDDLQAGFDTVASQVETIYDEITDTLSCD